MLFLSQLLMRVFDQPFILLLLLLVLSERCCTLGFSVKKARAFKAEAADIYTQYLKALAAQDLAKLGFVIPPERIFVMTPSSLAQSYFFNLLALPFV